jgi:pimeloyl-ACP methyl ester carboxylesterase
LKYRKMEITSNASLERDGAVVHFEVHGEDTASVPLLLTHGFGSSAAMWDSNVDALAVDRQIITWDVRGHGRTVTAPDPQRYTHGACVEDMAAILDACSIPCAAVGGLSLGGYLSLRFHLMRKERVAALLLCDCGPGYRDSEGRDRWNEFAESSAAALERNGALSLPTSAEARLGAGDPAALALAARGILMQHDASVIDSLASIDVPTLVLVGELDTAFRKAADYMAERIPGAELSVIPGAGHAANMDDPDAFAASVRTFLASAV